jgi:uncharacterized protein (DUF2384 family)
MTPSVQQMNQASKVCSQGCQGAQSVPSGMRRSHSRRKQRRQTREGSMEADHEDRVADIMVRANDVMHQQQQGQSTAQCPSAHGRS